MSPNVTASRSSVHFYPLLLLSSIWGRGVRLFTGTKQSLNLVVKSCDRKRFDARIAKAAGARYFTVIDLQVLPRFPKLRYIGAYIRVLDPEGPGSSAFEASTW